MPFVNDAQRRACFAQYKRDIEAGILPKWHCYEWEGKSKGKKSKSPSKRKSPSKGRKLPKRKIHIGPRGGKYIILDKKKVYV